MSIEQIILGNTEALIKLTNAIEALTLMQAGAVKSGAAKVKAEKEPVKNSPSVIKGEEQAVKEPVNYLTVKNLINKLALNHRDAIKELNKKHGLGVFADLLVDKNDVDSGVNDPKKLENYYADLLKIAELESA